MLYVTKQVMNGYNTEHGCIGYGEALNKASNCIKWCQHWGKLLYIEDTKTGFVQIINKREV